MLKCVQENERKQLVASIIEHSDSPTIEVVADFINMIELGYGRLAANGVEREFGKAITLEELEEIEKVFLEKVKQVLRVMGLFDLNKWRMTLHLIQSFDEEYTNSYLNEALSNDKNVLVFLSNFVIEWTGSGVEYEIMVKGFTI